MKWNSSLYDTKHSFVTKYGEDVVALLNPKSGEKILDLGCGTGDLAELITQQGAIVTGVDSSQEMIAEAKRKFPHITFEVERAENLNYHAQFDAVFSNATLHWVLEKEKAVECIFNALKPGGRFVAEFGGKNNVQKMMAAFRNALTRFGFEKDAGINIWYYPSIGEYASLLEKMGFRVEYAVHFDRQTELKGDDGMKNWFRMFRATFFKNLNEEYVDKILNDVETQLHSTHKVNGVWYADYKRLRIVATKK